MSLPLIITPEAEADLAEAKAWYERKNEDGVRYHSTHRRVVAAHSVELEKVLQSVLRGVTL